MSNTQMTPAYAERNPVVTVRDGEAFANSRDVAAYFHKNHRDVLRSIENLLNNEPELGVRNFAQGVYTLPETGPQEHRCFDMDRDGFALLAMGFTGSKALKWKMRYIEAFNAMQAEIERQAKSGPMIDMNDPGALRGLLLSYSEKAIALQGQIDELAPKGEALDRIAAADGSTCITDAAKTLQLRPKDLFGYLRQHHWIYRRAGTGTDLGYQSKVNSGLLEHKITVVTRADGTEKETVQVRVTAKGLTVLAKLLPPAATAA